jgi:hypothetical protein
MDTTIEVAMKIISNPSISVWRKAYWTNKVKEEIEGYRVIGLEKQAILLEKQLNIAVASGNDRR